MLLHYFRVPVWGPRGSQAGCRLLQSTQSSLGTLSPGQKAGHKGRLVTPYKPENMALQEGGQPDGNWWLRTLIASDVFFRPCQSCNRLKGRDCLVNFFDLETGSSACVACLPEHRGNRLLQVTSGHIRALAQGKTSYSLPCRDA